jgi:hypothetical protein
VILCKIGYISYQYIIGGYNLITLIFKKFVILCLLVFGIWAAAMSLLPAFAKAEGEPKSFRTEHKTYVEGEVIVKFKANLKGIQSLSLTKKNNLSLITDIQGANAQLLKINSNEKVESVLASLKDSGLVEFAQPNYIYYADSTSSNDAKFSELWGLNNTGQSIKEVMGTANVDLDAPEAWEYTNNLNEVIVAVIDTGVDINHPDLVGRTVPGWDFFNKNSSVYDEEDGDFHGTHVAGTIAASANSIGVSGVAPNVKIMPIKFLGPGGMGYTSDAILAINYAKSHGAQVINASWGGEGGLDDAALNAAIVDSGIIFVASAGNNGWNNDFNLSSPANLSAPNIISVAAIDNRGSLAWFSNYGALNVDVGAPGVDILSTFPKLIYKNAAVQNVANNYKTMALGFGLEFLELEDEKKIIKKTMDFFGVTPSASTHILIVEDGHSDQDNPDFSYNYLYDLQNLGYNSASGTHIDTIHVASTSDGPSLATLNSYNAVIWITGFSSGTFDPETFTITPNITINDQNQLSSLI